MDYSTQQRIKKKLLWFAEQENPIVFAETLTDSEAGNFRFRIGDYRIVFDVADDCIEVNKIDHRDSIYR